MRSQALLKFTDIETALKAKNTIISDYIEQSKYHKSFEKLNEGFKDAFQYAVVSKCQSRLKSTNLLERLNEEVRRSEKVIVLIHASANRLIGAVLIDRHED